MVLDLNQMMLTCREVAAREEAGTLTPPQASAAKLHNTRAARRIASDARDMLGGVGILLETTSRATLPTLRPCTPTREPTPCRASSWARSLRVSRPTSSSLPAPRLTCGSPLSGFGPIGWVSLGGKETLRSHCAGVGSRKTTQPMGPLEEDQTAAAETAHSPARGQPLRRQPANRLESANSP